MTFIKGHMIHLNIDAPVMLCLYFDPMTITNNFRKTDIRLCERGMILNGMIQNSFLKY